MILNIEGKNSPFRFNRLELNQFSRYTIRLIALNAVISSYVPGGIYKISSNLIDRESGNSQRILAYILLDRKQNIITFTPTQKCWYKMRLLDISSADIKIESISSDVKLTFSEFSCQFEVKENERV